MATKKDPSKIFAEMVEKAKLVSITLKESSCKLHGHHQGSYNIEFRGNAEMEELEGSFLVSNVELLVNVTNPKEDEESIAIFQVLYRVIYSIDGEGFPNDLVKAFAQSHGIYNCYPYFREFVDRSSRMMDLMIEVLPLLRPDQISEVSGGGLFVKVNYQSPEKVPQ